MTATDKRSDATEPLFTYTIITTESNQQLSFLHDRMPVILDNGSDAIRTWLDPNRTEWSNDLQSLLKPYDGELECYQVSKDVGKVGNNSPSFLVPINSAENKSNIANFFDNQRRSMNSTDETAMDKVQHDLENAATKTGHVKVEHDTNETRNTTNHVEGTEDNAPLPIPEPPQSHVAGIEKDMKCNKRKVEDGATAGDEPQPKRSKPISSQPGASPSKSFAKKQGTRSATSNGSAGRTPVKNDGSQKITAFFSNK
jgi:hypothetical protein